MQEHIFLSIRYKELAETECLDGCCMLDEFHQNKSLPRFDTIVFFVSSVCHCLTLTVPACFYWSPYSIILPHITPRFQLPPPFRSPLREQSLAIKARNGDTVRDGEY